MLIIIPRLSWNQIGWSGTGKDGISVSGVINLLHEKKSTGYIQIWGAGIWLEGVGKGLLFFSCIFLFFFFIIKPYHLTAKNDGHA